MFYLVKLLEEEPDSKQASPLGRMRFYVIYWLSRIALGATLTPQHLLFNRNALFAGGLRPHMYCLPVLNAKSIAWPCVRRPPAASLVFSSAPTRRRIFGI